MQRFKVALSWKGVITYIEADFIDCSVEERNEYCEHLASTLGMIFLYRLNPQGDADTLS